MSFKFNFQFKKMLESMESSEPWRFEKNLAEQWFILGCFLVIAHLIVSTFFGLGSKSFLFVDLVFGFIIGGWLTVYKNKRGCPR